MKKILVAVNAAVSAVTVAVGDGAVAFKGVFGTKGDYADVELTRSLMVNSGKTVSAFGAPTSALADAAHWSDGGEVSSEKDYVIVGVDGRVATYTGDTAFNGKSLTLGVVGGNAGYLVPVGETTLSVGGEGLVMNRGGMIWNSAYGKKTAFRGKLTVNATKSKPAEFWDHWSGNQMHSMNFTQLVGDYESSVKFTGQSNASDESTKNELEFSGDWSGFYGLMTIYRYYDKVTFSDIDCPGDLDYSTGTVLAIAGGGSGHTGSFRFGTMNLKSTTSITLGVDTTTNATMSTDSLTVVGDGKMPLAVVVTSIPRTGTDGGPFDLTTPARKMTLVDLPESSSAIDGIFDVSTDVPSSWSSEEKKFARYRSLVATTVSEEVSDGRRRLMLSIPKYTYTIERGKNNVTSILDHPEYWKGVGEGGGFCSDTAYFVVDDPTVSDGTITLCQNKDFIFTGGSLCLIDGYVTTGGRMTFSDLRIAAGVTLQFGGSGDHEFNGNITIFEKNNVGNSGIVHLWSKRNGTTTVNSSLHGNGKIAIDSASWSADEKQANRTVVLAGNNSGYAGRIYACNYADGYKTTLKIANGNNLGGPLASFTFDAIELRDRSVLEVGATTAVEEATRGIYARSGSTIKVPVGSDIFRIDSTLTCTGTVTKAGKGILALRNVAAIGAEKPELVIAEGGLLATGVGALKNLSVQFAAGTELHYDADAADAELLANGISMDGTELVFADDRLNVVCHTKDTVTPEYRKTIALLSGDAETVGTLADGLKVRLVDAAGNRRIALLEVVDSSVEGVKTLTATFKHNGTVVSVR